MKNNLILNRNIRVKLEDQKKKHTLLDAEKQVVRKDREKEWDLER